MVLKQKARSLVPFRDNKKHFRHKFSKWDDGKNQNETLLKYSRTKIKYLKT